MKRARNPSVAEVLLFGTLAAYVLLTLWLAQ